MIDPIPDNISVSGPLHEPVSAGGASEVLFEQSRWSLPVARHDEVNGFLNRVEDGEEK